MVQKRKRGWGWVGGSLVEGDNNRNGADGGRTHSKEDNCEQRRGEAVLGVTEEEEKGGDHGAAPTQETQTERGIL